MIDQEKKYFTDECSNSQCEQSYRYLFNSLATESSISSASCNFNTLLYECATKYCYVGYKDYLADKAGRLLLEGRTGRLQMTYANL